MNVHTELALQDLLKQFAKDHPDVNYGFVYIPSSISLIPARQIFDLQNHEEKVKEKLIDECEDEAVENAIDNGEVIDPNGFNCGDELVCEECPLAKSFIPRLIKQAHSTAKSKGWWNPPHREFGTLIALCHGELSEALEAYRVGDEANIREELADVIIRIFDICGHYEYDLEAAILAKMNTNETRPYRHGGKII